MRKYILYVAWIGLIFYLLRLTTWLGIAGICLALSLLGLGTLALISVAFPPAKRTSWRVYSPSNARGYFNDNEDYVTACPTLYRISRILHAGYVPVTDAAGEDSLEFRYPGKVRDYTYVSIDAAGRVVIGFINPVIIILVDQHSDFEAYFSKIPYPSIWDRYDELRHVFVVIAFSAFIFFVGALVWELCVALYERAFP